LHPVLLSLLSLVIAGLLLPIPRLSNLNDEIPFFAKLTESILKHLSEAP
jgi:hypothetical protein